MIKPGAFLTAIVTLTLACSPQSASAEQIPGLRGHDHTGITVPDVKAATAFFTDIIGCTHAMSFGPFSDDKGTFMQDVVNVNPRAVIDEISMVRCGYGSNIELFQYKSPDQAKDMPKNSDIGGHHIALYVDDIDNDVNALWWRLGLIGLGLILVTGLVSWLIAHDILSALERLKARMQHIARGSLDQAVEETGRGDEIGRMAETLEVLRQTSLTARSLEAARPASCRASSARRTSCSYRPSASPSRGSFRSSSGRIRPSHSPRIRRRAWATASTSSHAIRTRADWWERCS